MGILTALAVTVHIYCHSLASTNARSSLGTSREPGCIPAIDTK
jgi:hypothetical protein